MNIIPTEGGERVNAMLHVRDMEEDLYIVMVTKNGTIKRMRLDAIKNIRKSGIRALNIDTRSRVDEGDSLISVRLTDGTQNILIATHAGYTRSRVWPRGTGVRGIKLREGDWAWAPAELGGQRAALRHRERLRQAARPSTSISAGARTPRRRGAAAWA